MPQATFYCIARGVELSTAEHRAELQLEREYVAMLYQRLDAERASSSAALDSALRDVPVGSPQAGWQRQVAVDTATEQVRRLRVAESGLCFGRIDQTAGGTMHVGRIGLFDDDAPLDADDILLLDWRAPAARPFYCATPAQPEGLVRRRHLRTSGRQVLDFHDESFTLAAVDAGVEDSALFSALNAPRESTMRDIVATIQAEQDEIIRADHAGALVIEGGPGTGKTAVALHRVAYLLYSRREQLARRGVLIVGPNAGFLRYVGRVLPSLGETDVVFVSPGELMPGVRATALEDPMARAVKGSTVMVDVLAAAVADRQELPAEPIPIPLEDGIVKLDRNLVEAARAKARATGLLHNPARAVFGAAVLDAATERAVRRISSGWLRVDGGSATDRALRAELAAEVRLELRGSAALHAAIEQLWPRLTPGRLLRDLFGSRARIDAAGRMLTAAQRDVLFRSAPMEWTISDAPLLDEAVEFLGGIDDTEEQTRLAQEARIAYAEGVLQILDTDEDPDGEMLRAVDLIGAEDLAERQVEWDDRDLAERAAADREWTYGHVVIDEAQELSAMDWRVIMRRCPSRSMTIVGDLAQRESSAGATDWAGMLAPYVGDRWSYRELRTSYRTPIEIMTVAVDVLAEVSPTLRAPEAVRSSGAVPWAREVPPGELVAALDTAVRSELAQLGDGLLALIVAEELIQQAELLAASIGADRVHAMTPQASKGLEFDAVVIAEPQCILDSGPHGAAGLYVAVTRATQRLAVLHTGPLPAALGELVRR